ncbi:major facilitator transporter [Caballeronia calidae]|uniref:Major facilitator transporter n=1 Tax=Caballeronia calidae TaxID=1777139 RepID=A0A158DUW1_9BURK|nr:MFS transporter [Caballeronia calidae]SAK98210.1 major facilitator transporter [Caballeronia calidae]
MSSNSARRKIGAISIGNLGEIYDFTVFGFSVPFIAAHFFPSGSSTAAILSTFAVYAVAFVARPVGGIVFGYLMDRIGRVRVLSITIWLMALGTAAIGALPTYQQIGIAAPILLVLCRFAQGLAMGGEFTGSMIYIMESAPKGKRGSWVGIAFTFATLPLFLVTVILLGFQTITGREIYADWGWRIPFLIGGLIGIVGVQMRKNLEDPEEYKQAVRNAEFNDALRSVSRSARKSMLYVAMLMPVQAITAYLLLGFMYTFLVKQVGLDSKTALLANGAGIFVYSALGSVSGALSDRFGRKALLSAGSLWIALFAYLSIWLAANGSLFQVVLGQVALGIGIGLYGATCTVTSTELFPTHSRATSHAIAYQITVAILGGTTPLVCAWLVSALHSPLAPGWYVTGFAVLNFLLIQFLPETKDVDLHSSVEEPGAGEPTQILAESGRTGNA